MNKVRLASLALAAFAVSFGSVASADCGGRQGLLAKLCAKKEAPACGGGGLFAKLKAKRAAACCAPAPTCCTPDPAPTCCAPAPAPTCCAPAPAPTCCAPVQNCDCAAPLPVVSTGCSSCGTTMDAGVISTTTVVPPSPVTPAVPAAPASVSDKVPAA